MISEAKEQTKTRRWWPPSQLLAALVKQREEQVFLLVTLLIGALVGLTVVAFIVLTERFGARIDAAVAPAWRRLVVPIVGSLSMGFLLYRYFRTHAVAVCRKQKRPYLHVEGTFPFGRCWESFSALPRRLPAAFR